MSQVEPSQTQSPSSDEVTIRRVDKVIQLYGYDAGRFVITANSDLFLSELVRIIKARNSRIEPFKYVKEIHVDISQIYDKLRSLKRTLELAVMLHKKGVSKKDLMQVFPQLEPIIRRTHKDELEEVLNEIRNNVVRALDNLDIVELAAKALENIRELAYSTAVFYALWEGEYYSKFYNRMKPLYFGVVAYARREGNTLELVFNVGYAIHRFVEAGE